MVNDDRTTALRGVILDVDGTLIDSNDAHARSWVETLEEFGYDVAYDAVRSRIGEGGDKLLPQVSGVDAESEEGKRISKRRGELFKEKYLPTIQPFPKVRELLERMRDEGLTLAVGSSAQRHELEPFLEIANVADLIEETTSSSDAESSKPDPDIIHAALGELGYEPDEVLMVGDTPYDVEAAARAKVRTIAVRCGGWRDEDLEGAIAIYDDPADLLARFDDSPFAASKTNRR
jgi:HAD superfamily hydrolase (TIGR01509 family)